MDPTNPGAPVELLNVGLHVVRAELAVGMNASSAALVLLGETDLVLTKLVARRAEWVSREASASPTHSN